VANNFDNEAAFALGVPNAVNKGDRIIAASQAQYKVIWG